MNGYRGWLADAPPAGGVGGLNGAAREVGGPTAEGDDVAPLTDTGNAERLIQLMAGTFRYIADRSEWFCYRDGRWGPDDLMQVEWLTKRISGMVRLEAERADDEEERGRRLRWADASHSRRKREDAIALARSEPAVAAKSSAFDTNPHLLNVANGTLDLKDGSLRGHRREDMITRMCPVPFDPDAACPNWDGFLDRVMGGNGDLIAFLGRAVGYSLTADVSEHALFFLHGTGANGKSTFLNAVRGVLGDYACTVRSELLTANAREEHPTGLTDLEGRRFVDTIEVEDGKRMAESLVKSLTGGDKIRARRMRQDFYQFSPTFKLWLAANHMPVIRGTDDGIWRRVKLIPFEVTIPEAERDRGLESKLAAEWPGILAWAVRGCLEWQRSGLAVPPVVAEATQEFRRDMDVLGAFIEECCFVGRDYQVVASELYGAYKAWAERSGYRAPLSSRRFGAELNQRSFGTRDSNSKRWRMGITLKPIPSGQPDRSDEVTDSELPDFDGHCPELVYRNEFASRQ